MKEFILIVLFGGNTAVNGPAIIDGFKSESLCRDAGTLVIQSIGKKFSDNSVNDLRARFECIEVNKG